MESYTVCDFHKLTEVSLITNEDGIHTKETVIGYVAEEPFVVLTAWINKYIISAYNDKLYPIGYCSFKHTIGLRDAGSVYSPRNLIKHYFCDLSSFESMNPAIELAALDEYSEDEQLKLLSSILQGRPDVQKAIDCQTYIDALNDKDDCKQDYIVKIMDTLKDIKFGLDPEMDFLAAYVMKRAVENINDL